ncbi:MAG: winged helix-turn-helix domain-containing protein [Promethearchaeota archaeon]
MFQISNILKVSDNSNNVSSLGNGYQRNSLDVLWLRRNSILPSIYDAFKEGKSRAADWRQLFEETRSLADAFKADFILKAPDSFVLTNEVNLLSQVLGQILNSKNEGSLIVTIIGPQRSGKSVSVQQITNELNHNLGKDYAQYRAYDPHFWDWWEEADFNSTQLFFFDNIYPIWSHLTQHSLKDLTNRSNHERILVVTILNSIEHHWLRFSHKTSRIKIFDTEPFEFHFKRPSPIEIENIIKRRAEILGKPNLFSQEVLDAIQKRSFGLPGLALWLVRNAILDYENQEKNEISPLLIHKTAQYLGFDPALRIIYEHDLQSSQQNEDKIWPELQKENSDSSPLIHSLTQSRSITKSWRPLLEEMLLLTQKNDEVKRSELQERTGIKESSLTYQCQNLVKERIIVYTKKGREVFYQLRTPIKEALELTLFGS